MLEARNRIRRSIRPPAASIVRCHASERATSATVCSPAAAARIHHEALESAVAKSWRRPERAKTSAAIVTTAPPMATATRCR